MDKQLTSLYKSYLENAPLSAANLLEIVLNNFLEKKEGRITLAELKNLCSGGNVSKNIGQELKELKAHQLIMEIEEEEEKSFIINPVLPKAKLKEILLKKAGQIKSPLVAGHTLQEVLAGFMDYLKEEGLESSRDEKGPIIITKGENRHCLFPSLTPFSAPLHAGQYSLLLGNWDQAALPAISPYLIKKSWLRQLALYNLQSGTKINLVPTGVFPYFDWYLRDKYGLRIAPCAYFTRALMKAGILRFEG